MAEASEQHPARIPPHVGDGIKDSIESIVVALILAFVFRAFVVEAFVIPTGSMAPTLYGVHGTQICQNCGTSYAYGLKEDGSHRGNTRTCPNCGHADNQPDIKQAGAESGDRILVLKWPFDIGGDWLGPQRWDVVVFKTPSDGVTNYIKRLIGLPNEVLEIIDGDIYAVPIPVLEEKDPGLLDLLDQQRRLDAELGRASYADSVGRDPKTSIAARLDQLRDEIGPRLAKWLKIQRKSNTPTGRRAQRSLWLGVYNHDYKPRLGPADRQPRWVPTDSDSFWNTSSHAITFAGSTCDEQVLRFQNGHVDPNRQGGQSPHIPDTYAYNRVLEPNRSMRNDVADLRLRFILEPHHMGDASRDDSFIRLTLSKGLDTFVTTLHADGRCTLLRRGATVDTSETYPPVKTDPLTPGQPFAIDFANVDYRVRLRLDDKEVLAAPYDASVALTELRAISMASSQPGKRPAPPKVEISAAHMDLTLLHVVVERDVYYQYAPMMGNADHFNPWIHRPGWGVTGHPILLRAEPKEYFMLGDNSPQSADSRLWGTIGPHLVPRGDGYQPGTVPEDQLIGRAFFVYWPSGMKLFPGLPIRMVPNVGEMRWIR